MSFCTLQSRIAAAEQKKALIEETKFFNILTVISWFSGLVSVLVSMCFICSSLLCMYSDVVSYSMLDILQFWKPHVADVLAWYGDVISPPINEARVLCLILVIFLTLCVCSLLGSHISLRSTKRKKCQAFDSKIEKHNLDLDQTKKALAQQVTETVETPKLYQAYQRLAFMLMGGQSNDRVRIHDYDVEQSVAEILVDLLGKQFDIPQEKIDQFELEIQEKTDQQQQQDQSARKIQSVFSRVLCSTACYFIRSTFAPGSACQCSICSWSGCDCQWVSACPMIRG